MGVRRPELVVAAAILVTLPALPSFLDGAIGPLAALVRFALALAVSWAVGAVVERVYDAYARQARTAAVARELEEARRRREEANDAGI